MEQLGPSAGRRGLHGLPFCPFLNSYIDKHREYRELVPEAQWRSFGFA